MTAIAPTAAIARRPSPFAIASPLATLAQRLTRTTPHDDEWERSYRALQEQARRTLAAVGGDLGTISATAGVKITA